MEAGRGCVLLGEMYLLYHVRGWNLVKSIHEQYIPPSVSAGLFPLRISHPRRECYVTLLLLVLLFIFVLLLLLLLLILCGWILGVG